MRATLVLASALCALAACSQKPAATNAAPAQAAATTSPGDMPAPTAGLWQRVSTQDGAPPETSTKCLTGKPIDPTEGGPPCPGPTIARSATGGFVYDADCSANGVSMKLHMTGEGDFKQSFTTDATAVMSGGPGGAMTTKNHSVYTFKSATCAAG